MTSKPHYLTYGSVCSGIEAATVAWHPLGWKPAWFSEIDKFPCAVLKHHYPNVPNLGDMEELLEHPTLDSRIGLLVGGTPCQSFSIAGLRKGMDDPRGNLARVFCLLAKNLKPKWIVWENVPGVLSSNNGEDFGSFLGALGELGYGWTYRVLDAQNFGVPQRRRRVFVVGYLGDWRPAAAVLFEQESLCWSSGPCEEEGEDIASEVEGSTGSSGFTTSSFGGYQDGTGTCRAAGGDLGGGSETLIVDCFDNRSQHPANLAPTLRSGGTGGLNIPVLSMDKAIAVSGDETPKIGLDVNPPLRSGNQGSLCTKSHIRRLTPKECERLQGFPDDYTNIPGASDTARYNALGNSMAVPVMNWIGRRIQMVEEVIHRPRTSCVINEEDCTDLGQRCADTVTSHWGLVGAAFNEVNIST